MISKKQLKFYEFKEISDYFNYIVESQVNGNLYQVKSLFKSLSKEQKNEFYIYLKDNEIKFNYTGLF